MTEKKTIEIYSAECPVCKGTIDEIIKAMCPTCDVAVFDTHDPEIAERVKKIGIHSVPAVVVDGKVISGSSGAGMDIEAVKEAVGRGS